MLSVCLRRVARTNPLLKALTASFALAGLLTAASAAHAVSTVPAQRILSLSRGINADNIVNNTRLADYSADDRRKLKWMGITHVRIPIDISYVLTGVPITGQDAPSDPARVALGLATLDAAVASFTADGFVVTLDSHPMPPVYRLPIAQSQALILQAADVLSSRYAGQYSPDQLLFEALDEPRYDVATWNAFAPQVVAAIRRNAPEHTVVVGPASWYLAENFARLTPLEDPNIVYAMHVYEPLDITSQGTPQVMPLPHYRFPNKHWSYARVDAYMHVGIDWASAHQVPLIMNEFGATRIANHESRMNWVRFVRHTAERNRIGWAYWSYDGKLFGVRPRDRRFDWALVLALSSQSAGS